MTVSPWAREVLGAAAQPVQDNVVVAICQAHDDAQAAQLVSGTSRQDPYGHTLKNRQYECLVQALREAAIPGGIQVYRPAGVTFDLVRLNESNIVLFPWRFSPDQSITHDSAKLPAARASAFRRGMLTTTAEDTDQLSIDDAAATDEELAAQAAQFRDVEAQLRTMARVVTIGYASNFTGIFELGWGEASLNEDGTVTWTPWRDLTHLMVAEVAAPNGQTTPGAAAGRAGLRPVVAADDTAAAIGPRFDDAPLAAGFGLQPRSPQAGEPQAEEDPKDVDVDAGDQSES